MLIELYIKNYAIIDELQLEFQDGMIVLSGETGAGKSIIIDALALAIGGRTDIQVIRHGEARCEITACFDINNNSAAKAWLNDNEIQDEDHPEQCIFRRIITQDGRSKSMINGQVFPVQKTRELAQYLVDIHGQHEHQSLLKPETHRSQLDDYCQHAELLEPVAQHYKACQVLQTELQTLSQAQTQDDSARKALLTYQLEELQEAALEEGEWETLNQEHTMLSQAESWLQQAQTIHTILTAEEASVESLLNSAISFLPRDAMWNDAQSLLDNTLVYCREADEAVRYLMDRIEMDPEKLQRLDMRIQQLHALSRKHHVSVEELPKLQQTIAETLDALETGEERKALLEEKLKAAEEAYHASAKRLSESRKEKAGMLGAAITEHLRQLGLVHGQLEVRVEPQNVIRQLGYDKVEYYLITNPDQPARPLIKIASGGELSRISLAIEVVTTAQNQGLTRLFDEVDVGISGKTAAVVGKLLRQLGEKSQIFCITHQPQVAGLGNHHFLVEKSVHPEQGTLRFNVKALNREEKIQEVARMLGGLEVTPHTLAHAAELVVSP